MGMADMKPIQWRVKSMDRVDSTQTEASRLGSEGAPEGTVVVARMQTAGRGRRGRSWTSPDGGLYMSLLVRPPSSKRAETLTLVAALAVVRGIEAATGLKAQIRWPNDVVIRDKKVAGALAESNYRGEALSFVTVGIGVNCNSKITSDSAASPATSLVEGLGRNVDIVDTRKSILKAFADLYSKWLGGADPVEAVRSGISTLGKRVVVLTTAGKTLEGFAEGMEPSGGLRLNLDGRKLTIHAEDIEWLRET